MLEEACTMQGSWWKENTLCPHHFQRALSDLDMVAELVEKLNKVFTYINGHATAPLGVCTFTVGEVKFGLVLTQAQCDALPGDWDQGPPAWQPGQQPGQQ
jgi:hypothetical protein